jgi:hypothetical protein
LIDQAEKISINLKYKNLEKSFSATPEKAWIFINNFFSEFLPSFKIASNLLLTVNLQNLAKDCEGLIAFSPEGANLLVNRKRLTDNETLLLWLLASYLGSKLGVMINETISKEELQTKLGKSSKITSTRLGELVKSDMVIKMADEKYKITTFGINQMQVDIIPKVKAKITP